MPLQISIPDDDTKYLIPAAVADLQTSVLAYSKDLIKEAGRLEANIHTGGQDPQITSSMIKDANLLLRQGYRRPGRGGLLKACQIAATVSAIITGLLANLDLLKKPGWLVIFLIASTFTITMTVVVVVRD